MGVWAGSLLSLYTAFFLQLEPAQWAAVTVWLIFMQVPRLNYLKVLSWGLGTIAGATFAIFLIAVASQHRLLFLVGLVVWMSACAYAANMVKSFFAFGVVLAGFTVAIVSLSAIEQPEEVFHIAIVRVSDIFIAIASAVAAMIVFLPKHPHWKETGQHLKSLSQQVLACVADSMLPTTAAEGHSSWGKVNDHVTRLEHTLTATTAESAESRVRASAARNIVARLLCLLAKSQSIEESLRRLDINQYGGVAGLLADTRNLLELHGAGEAATRFPAANQIREISQCVRQARLASTLDPACTFILLRVEEVLREIEALENAWDSLDNPQKGTCPSKLIFHQDRGVAMAAALRMALAMGFASLFWVVVGWSSGAGFVLFTAVVAGLLSLQEDPRTLGWNFLKGASICAVVAFFDLFWLLQRGEGFLLMAIALGLFLVPASYIYRKPALRGSSACNVLLFYALLSPSNQMTYDVISFLNNSVSLLFASGFAFFAFHVILPPSPAARCFSLLKDIWRDLEQMVDTSGPLGEQKWVSLLGDRIRLLHRFSTPERRLANDLQAHLGLQLGLRRLRLQHLIHQTDSASLHPTIQPVLRRMMCISSAPYIVVEEIGRACQRLEKHTQNRPLAQEMLAELHELSALLNGQKNLSFSLCIKNSI